MMLLNIAFEVLLAEGNFQSFFLMITKSLAAVFRSSFYKNVCWSKGFVEDLLRRDLKDVKNNRNTLFELTFLFTSISFKVKLS